MRLPHRVLRRLSDATARNYVRYGPTELGKGRLAVGLVARYRADPRRALARTPFGAFAIRSDDLLQSYLYLFGVWEPHITRWLTRTLRSGDTFIDVGANVGYFSVLASRLVGGSGKVVAIEASPEFSEIVALHLRLNSCTNVRVVNVAASDHDGVASFFQPCQHNLGHTTQYPEEPDLTPAFTIDCQPLPSILTRSELANARVVKVDVEGGERQVLDGLLPVMGLLRDDVELLLEVNPNLLARQGTTAADLIEQLERFGFHPYRVDNGYCVPDYLCAARAFENHPPRRLGAELTTLSDIVFSRRDDEAL